VAVSNAIDGTEIAARKEVAVRSDDGRDGLEGELAPVLAARDVDLGRGPFYLASKF
jgi:hypothetical protein